jgi:[ribosomal protein S5]-alanine N-acetyltransferase
MIRIAANARNFPDYLSPESKENLMTVTARILETARLRMTPLSSEHVSDLHRHIMSDADVMRYIGTGATSTYEQAEGFVRRVKELYSDSPIGWFAISSKPDASLPTSLLGIACLKPLSGDLKQAFGEHTEVGYWLAKAAWRKGVATEAAARLLQYAFRELNAQEVVGVAHADNIGSNRVLQKLGMDLKSSLPLFGALQNLYAISVTSNSAP